MRVGLLVDRSPYVGGQELSMDAIATSCPGEVVHITPGSDWPDDLDVCVIGNCTHFKAEDVVPYLVDFGEIRIVKRVADTWENGDPVLRDWLLTHADLLVFLSPNHLKQFPYAIDADVQTVVVPPYIDLERFSSNGYHLERRGTLWVGNMHNPDRKGIPEALEWAQSNREIVDFYGEAAPDYLHNQEFARVHPFVKYSSIPCLFKKYERFIFLPQHNEAFGRTVIEALAAGCHVITNAVPGSMWFVETDQVGVVQESQHLFWEVVQSVIT